MSFTPLPPREITPGICGTGGWVGPRAGLDSVENSKALPLPGIEPLSIAVIDIINYCTKVLHLAN
jgi:hypothetical protein